MKSKEKTRVPFPKNLHKKKENKKPRKSFSPILILKEQLEALFKLLGKNKKSLTMDDIHEIRTTSRSLMAIVQSWEWQCPSWKEPLLLAEILRRNLKELGPVRDCGVISLLLEGENLSLSSREEFRKWLEEREKKSLKEWQRKLWYDALQEQKHTLLRTWKIKSGSLFKPVEEDHEMPEALPIFIYGMLSLSFSQAHVQDFNSLHEMRKKLKIVRYLTESGLLGSWWEEHLPGMKACLGDLGAMQDTFIFVEYLRKSRILSKEGWKDFAKTVDKKLHEKSKKAYETMRMWMQELYAQMG